MFGSSPSLLQVSPKDRTDDASVSSGPSQEFESPVGPITPPSSALMAPAATPAVAASRGRKYWPSDREILTVLGLLTEQDRQACDTEMASRYLRATGGNAKHAAKRIADTLSWRRQERPDLMACTACMANPRSHYMQVVGRDLEGRPLIYSCLALATNRDVEDNRKHMLSTFEQAIRLMPSSSSSSSSRGLGADSQPAGEQSAAAAATAQQQHGAGAGTPGQQSVESWCWVLDFHGFSIKDCDPRLAKIFLNLSAAHYPERLGMFFLISAPTLFNTLWRAISAFIDPVTKQKIHFVDFSVRRDNTQARQLLGRHFDASTTAWLMREMEENRGKGAALRKAYSYSDLSRLAAAGLGASPGASVKEQRGGHAACTSHDHLGTPGFLDELAGRPELLLPHLQQLAAQQQQQQSGAA